MLEIFVAGNTPPCAVLFTAGKWFEPIEIDLIVGESPQATAVVVGGAGGIAVGHDGVDQQSPRSVMESYRRASARAASPQLFPWPV